MQYPRRPVEVAYARLQRAYNRVLLHPAVVRGGLAGRVFALLDWAVRRYRDSVWNRFAYNRDGRLTNRNVALTLGGSVLVVAGLGALLT